MKSFQTSLAPLPDPQSIPSSNPHAATSAHSWRWPKCCCLVPQAPIICPCPRVAHESPQKAPIRCLLDFFLQLGVIPCNSKNSNRWSLCSHHPRQDTSLYPISTVALMPSVTTPPGICEKPSNTVPKCPGDPWLSMHTIQHVQPPRQSGRDTTWPNPIFMSVHSPNGPLCTPSPCCIGWTIAIVPLCLSKHKIYLFIIICSFFNQFSTGVTPDLIWVSDGSLLMGNFPSQLEARACAGI